MFDLEIVRPSVDEIKRHGPSLNNIFKLTQQAFNSCQDEYTHSDTAKLGQCLDLIAAYYGFGSFGALKYFLSDTNADILPVQDTKTKVLDKLSQIYSLPSTHELIQAYYQTLVAYIEYSNLPDSINITTDGHYFNSLLSMRYLQIKPWDYILRKLIKNPHYQLPDSDVYEYSTIDRLVRVNILNNMLPLAKAAAFDKKQSFTAPLSTFFGGQITKRQFLSEIAEFFDGKAIGAGLIEAHGIQPLAIDNPMYAYMLSLGPAAQDIYAFEDDDNVSSMLISFKLLPRLESMFMEYMPVRMCPKIKIDADLITLNKAHAIQYANGQEKKSGQNDILIDMITNLSHLNSVLSLPKAAWYQAEPTTSQSQLAWRKYVINYAEIAVATMIRLANSILIQQRATLKRVYFDENGLLMFNFPKPIQLKPSSGFEQSEISNYEFSLFINFLMVAKHLNKLNLDAPEKIHLRLMRNYLKAVYPTTLPDPHNQRARITVPDQSAVVPKAMSKPMYMGQNTETGKESYMPINQGENYIISGIPTLAPYHFFQKSLIDNRVDRCQAVIYVDGSRNSNQLSVLQSILKKHGRESDLMISDNFDFDIEQAILSRKILYIPLHKLMNKVQVMDGINQFLKRLNEFVLHITNSQVHFDLIMNQAEQFTNHSSWGPLYEKSANYDFNIFQFCRKLNDLSHIIVANSSHKFMFWLDDDAMRSQFSAFYQEPELLEQLPAFIEQDYILLNRSDIVRYRLYKVE